MEQRRPSPDDLPREAGRLLTEQGDGGADTARHLGRNVTMGGRWQHEWTASPRRSGAEEAPGEVQR